MDSATSVSFPEALRFWTKLGFISFGGPAGQIAIMHRELVEQRQWISEERFLHALNFCMLLPGPEAQQLAIYIGWLKHRVLGGVAAGVLFVLPGFILITAISALYAVFRTSGHVQGVLFGLKAAVLAIILEALHRIAKRALRRRSSWVLALSAFVALFAFDISFPLVVLAAALIGFMTQRHSGNEAPAEKPLPIGDLSVPTRTSSLKTLLICMALWLTPILLLRLSLGEDHVLSVESVFFSKMAVVTFGGAYAVLAYVGQEAVERLHWLSVDDMMQGLALAETTPGPLILVLTFVGFLSAYSNPAPFAPLWAGLLGALVTTWVTFVPCFLWILLGAPYVERLRSSIRLSAALEAVTAAVVGVIANLALWFALYTLFHDIGTWRGVGMSMAVPTVSSIDIPATILAFAAAMALLIFKLPMVRTLLCCAVIGVVIKALN